ncbi:unnamed protein product [Bursaphelenchus xylophilus]|uniref:Flavin-containing monooxygenase n=1 Tax=Bursaphelenchus xylophilus TaxID=6326 RepID=A0A1I7S1M3_BURXY|nr:unnamed protein product [Bursaphelenchus xylophilus]CAG9081267.1 unnamed protein product [Bursaphelenchus xylophilus]
MFGRKRCAIVGAGVSGLPSARWAKEYGYDPVIFELRDNLGGLWYYTDDKTEFSCVSRKTIMNTSKEMTAFSDFPPPANAPWYLHNSRMLEYLHAYAEHHDLLKYCRFSHRVTRIERSPNFDKTGEWIVEFRDGNGEVKSEVFQAVLLCTGRQSVPKIPNDYPGQSGFEGGIVHSKDCKDFSHYKNKNVLCVGLGNSGIEQTCEISQVAKKCFLSTRNGTWILGRIDNDIPIDIMANTRLIAYLGKILGPRAYGFLIERMMRKSFNHQIYGLKPEHRVINQSPAVISDELKLRLASGQIAVKPGLKQFNSNSIEFVDGSVEPIDEVVFSTGYSCSFEYVEDGKLIPKDYEKLDLWKNMFPVSLAEMEKPPTLAVIGLLELTGSLGPASELQARAFFEVITGNIKLPSTDQMALDVQNAHKSRRLAFYTSKSSFTKIPYMDYIEDMSKFIGCYADPSKLFWSDPKLAYRLVFGPELPYATRLIGPFKWEKARDLILTLDERLVLESSKCKCDGRTSKKSKIVPFLVKVSFFLSIIAILVKVLSQIV